MKKAKLKDLEKIMTIIEDAKIALKEDGIDQWQNGLPRRENIRKNIEDEEGFVYLFDDKIAAFVYLKQAYEKDYENIEARFKIHEKFLTIHRLCVSKDIKNRGIGKKFIEEIIAYAIKNKKKAIRIDTHRKNFKMKALIGGFNFKEIGICFVDDGKGKAERIAYELVL